MSVRACVRVYARARSLAEFINENTNEMYRLDLILALRCYTFGCRIVPTDHPRYVEKAHTVVRCQASEYYMPANLSANRPLSVPNKAD